MSIQNPIPIPPSEAGFMQSYLDALGLVERLHRLLLDVIKDEFERVGVLDINAVQALLLFNIGIEIGQDVFVFLVLALKRSFRQLEIHWPQWAVRLPGYAVGVAGAFWTLEHTTALFLPGG